MLMPYCMSAPMIDLARLDVHLINRSGRPISQKYFYASVCFLIRIGYSIILTAVKVHIIAWYKFLGHKFNYAPIWLAIKITTENKCHAIAWYTQFAKTALAIIFDVQHCGLYLK